MNKNDELKRIQKALIKLYMNVKIKSKNEVNV